MVSLLRQTQVEVLPRRSFADAVNVYRRLTSSRGGHPPSRERASSRQGEALRTASEVSGGEGILPQDGSIGSYLISSLQISNSCPCSQRRMRFQPASRVSAWPVLTVL